MASRRVGTETPARLQTVDSSRGPVPVCGFKIGRSLVGQLHGQY
jgi:hypothetical protein